MSSTRYERFGLWVKNKSQSTPAQWIGSLGRGFIN